MLLKQMILFSITEHYILKLFNSQTTGIESKQSDLIREIKSEPNRAADSDWEI